jgi:hypothetical protein
MINKYLKHCSSIIINIIYLTLSFYRIPKDLADMIKIARTIRTIDDVVKMQYVFYWRKDKFFDWKPWVITMFTRNLMDDCDGAATLGKWLLKKAGIKSRCYRVFNRTNRHLIVISNNRKYMISNSEVFTLRGVEDWKKEALRLASGQTGKNYTGIEKF